MQVTNGGSEANYLAVWRLVEPGDEVVLLVPNYMQTWGVARAFGGTIREWPLIEDSAAGRWRPDIAALETLVSDKTRLIIICTPNNPTGATLSDEELDAVAAIAARHAAWVLSDEVYRGAELSGEETPSMWGATTRSSSPAACRRPMACQDCVSAGSSARPRWSRQRGRATTTRPSPLAP